jgi:hypothetical protein
MNIHFNELTLLIDMPENNFFQAAVFQYNACILVFTTFK